MTERTEHHTTGGARTVVWFNKGVSSTYNVIDTIQEAKQPGDNMHLICSHTDDGFTGAGVSDEFILEPKGPTGSAYIEWCLRFVAEHQVNVFFPYKDVHGIAANEHRFLELGCKPILPGPLATIKLLDNKAALYRHLGPDVVPLPEHYLVNTLAEFDAAYADLSARCRRVCFKPAVGINGSGFRAITTSVETDALARIFSGEDVWIGLDEIRHALGLRERFNDLIVMPYLPGLERSIDCLAHDGKLVQGVVRVKMNEGYDELLEENPRLIEYARRLTERLGLRGLYNVQFMDSAEREPFLLEINARQAGGAHFSALSGVTLPYWAIRLATGTATPEQVPAPARLGIRVRRASKALLVK